MQPNFQLHLGVQNHLIQNANALLLAYRSDPGYSYYCYKPQTPPDRVVLEDLAITLLMNSRAGLEAARSLIEKGHSIDLSILPKKPLAQTTPQERETLAIVISELARLKGFAASLATKLLHKKRPALIPILDNQAIFGAYLNPAWPTHRSSQDSVKDLNRIISALNQITFDLTRPENILIWEQLEQIEPRLTRIEIFDSIWWMYFRKVEPVKR
jgi:hypothetical protein